MTKESLIQLAHIANKAQAGAPVAYSYGEENFTPEQASAALREELNKLTASYSLYRENKNTIFALIEETIDDVLPKKVMEQFRNVAEFKTVAQGDKAVFVQKITNSARQRAKQFVTRVGLAGRYEVFKLDGRELTVTMTAIGGAAQIGFEEFLDGRVDFAELTSIIAEAMDEFILAEIQKALIAMITDLPVANKHANAGWSESDFDKLLAIARAYGDATVYCTYEFASKMLPSTTDWISEKMRDERWANGRLLNYKLCNVVIWDQSFMDETNAVRVIDPSFAFIIPSGAKKPVKIAFEGQTHVREAENEDWSRELQTYKKFGVAVMATNDICVYRDLSLASQYATEKNGAAAGSVTTTVGTWDMI
jgi:hypothetical protein